MKAALDESSEPLPFVTLETGDSSAKIYLFGACVTSYVKDGKDCLMVRPDAKMDGSKPISGGIPHCFPQFGPGEIQQHGFARNLPWVVDSLADGVEPKLVLKLTPSDYTKGMWDKEFEATYTVTLKEDSLICDLGVKNTGSSAFDFTTALHTYWSISSIKNAKITGDFQGATFLNKMLDPPAEQTCESGEIVITEETDSVYKGVTGDVVIEDSGIGRKINIKATGGWEDTVLWNPYGNEGMGYDSFVCVECAKALSPVNLAPAETWTASMSVVPEAL
uniref:glucose-6-phosphate 1-epimerase n=2 Tax=Choreotrichia TaxID=141411 RepID=A0A7S3VW40_9SPIT